MREFVRSTRRRGVDLVEVLAGSQAVWVWVAVVVVGLATGWSVAVARASATDVARHLFYVPVVFAAVRFGVAGGLGAGLAAGLLAGPLVALPAEQAAVNVPAVWGPRLGFFVLVGVVTALLVELVEEVQAQQAEAAKRAQEQRLLLIQTLSHEFRTPVTLMRGTAETLQREDLDAGTREQLTGMLGRSSRNLERLLEAVLAAAGVLETDDHSSARLRRIADEVLLDLNRPDAHSRVNVEVEEGAVTAAQRAALCFAATELITNALKYSPDDQPVEVRLEPVGSGVKLAVRDHGPGLDATTCKQALEPFRQLDASTTRQRGGLGLGLFAVNRMVEQHDGALELINHPDGGLLASVSLDASTPAGPGPSRQGLRTPTPRLVVLRDTAAG